ncbi:hypothetical protein ACFQ7N_40530 [Streptomyces niveus]|uniref:hypothetical protein n=1 Tax=Streptomyces niveus TaxID=193462 RepID=UPI003695B684
MISGDRVRRVHGGKDAPNTPQAIEARRIASFLSLACQRAGAKIVHNEDARYVGVRMETRVGPVVLEMPTEAGGNFRLVHEFIEPKPNGDTSSEILHLPPVYKPQGIALMTSQVLASRGFLA